MWELIIRTGKHAGRKLTLGDVPVVIGRDETCQIRLASAAVSRQHCQLSRQPEGVLVKDLASQNGTYVNEVAITDAHLMKHGDVLRVGVTQFEIVAPRRRMPKPADANIDDDAIAGWLSDHDTPQVNPETDTAVLPRAQRAGRSAEPASTPSSAASAATPVSPTTRATAAPVPPTTGATNSSPLIQQAAKIIQDYWEQQAQSR